MGTISVRVEDSEYTQLKELEVEASRTSRGPTSFGKAISDRVGELVLLSTDNLAESLSQTSRELGQLFAGIREVADFELDTVEVGLEISAEGGFNLIGSASLGGKGAINLRFSPKKKASPV